MKLTDLEPQFYRYETRIESYEVVDGVWNDQRKVYLVGDGRTWDEAGRPTKEVTGPREYLCNVDTLQEAQGIMFLCPKCFRDNNGPVGTHRCPLPFAGRGVDPAKNQWNVTGSGYADLSTTPSYLIVGGCSWHGYITNGQVSIL